MATDVNVFGTYAASAISELFEKEYLLDNLDWDGRGQKYTLRIRGADRKPMVGVGLIVYKKRGNMIMLIDAVKKNETAFQIDRSKNDNMNGFLNCVLSFAQRLREEASYQ